jgi:vanillate O-demethylase monooxygenase subunit
LINDNLLDLSHLSWVHRDTLGRNTMSWGESRARVTSIARGLNIARWVVNQPAPLYLDLPAETRTDLWASYDYVVPGVFLLTAASYPPGTAAACGGEAPSAAPMWQSLTSQAVTPIAERETVYYYSGCLEKRLATEESSRQQIAFFEKAFAEDKAIIEAQQQVIAATPETRMLRLAADGALNRFRRLMADLMAAEQPADQAIPQAAE